MPNLEKLKNMIAEKLDKEEGGETWYSSVDMTHTDEYWFNS